MPFTISPVAGFTGLCSRPSLFFFQAKGDVDATAITFDAMYTPSRLLSPGNRFAGRGRVTGRGVVAAKAATEETTHVVLVGYPLRTQSGARDGLLREG